MILKKNSAVPVVVSSLLATFWLTGQLVGLVLNVF